MHKDRETSFYTQEILYPEPGFPIRFYYDRLSIEHALKYNLVGLECERQLWQHNRWSRFRPIHRSRILTLEVLFPSSCRTSFSSFSRCTGSSVKVTVARMERTDGASVAYSRRCDAVAASGETRSSRRKLEAGALVRGAGRKTRRTRGEEYCILLGGLCFRGRERACTSKRSKIFAGRDRFSPWVVSLVHRDCQLMFRSGYLNALFGETKLEFRTILLDGVSHCPRLCVAASLSLLILVCYQQWFYDSYVGNTRGIHVYSRYVLVGSMDA